MKTLLYLYICLIIVSCNKKEHPPVSFYYWKQTFTLNKNQNELLKKLKTKKIHTKYFDVVLEGNNKHAKPISKINFTVNPTQEIVPCVYIQNNVFKYNENQNGLATKISKLIQQISKRNSIHINEIQIDCDWTNSTQLFYFQFLKELKKINPSILITSTIRLHQLKYPNKTGIPPVKKGVLMCYNMDDIDHFETQNSIISSNILAKYINKKTNYVLPLDLALPIYQWGLVFRLGKLSLILNDVTKKDLSNSNFIKVDKNIYKVLKNHYIKGKYMCKGDLVRFENSSLKILKDVIKTINSSHLEFNQLILYHISQENLNLYHEQFFKQINSTIP